MSRKLYIAKMLDLYDDKTRKELPQFPSGVIDISCPITGVTPDPNDPSVGGRTKIRAIIDGDIHFSMGNTWDKLLDIGTDISDWQQTLNLAAYNLLNWVSASSVGWKGSDPLTIQFSCYLVTYKANQISIKQQALNLVQLAAIYCNTGGNNVMDNCTVRVHGGYVPHFFVGNANIGDWRDTFNNFSTATDLNEGIDGAPSVTFKDIYENGVNNDTGFVKLHWGGPGGIDMTGLLLDKCEVEVSSVQCKQGEPLWIKLTPSFRTYRAMTTSDVDRLFGEYLR